MTDEAFLQSITDVERELAGFYQAEVADYVGKDILEIGSGWGLFTRFMMMYAPRSKVTTIDKIGEPKSFTKNTAGYEDRITRLTGDSKDYMPAVADESFDTVMVDGDHGYEGCKSDLMHAFRIVRRGGVVIVDDIWHEKNFEDDYGIMQAVSELAMSKGLKVTVHPEGHGVALIFKD